MNKPGHRETERKTDKDRDGERERDRYRLCLEVFCFIVSAFQCDVQRDVKTSLMFKKKLQ